MSTAASASGMGDAVTAATRGPHRPGGRRAALGAVALAAVLLVAVDGAAPAGASPSLQATGSSFAGVAIQQWVGQASTLYGLNINWQVSSSVLGLESFAQGQVDFGASDIPYSSNQSDSTPSFPYEYMPDVAGALAFMYNLQGNDGNQITNLVLNSTAVEDIFTGRITKWNDPVIAGLNPQLQGDLPSTTIVAAYRNDASGENYLLSDYLLHMNGGMFEQYQNDMTSAFPGQPTATWPTPPNGQAPPGYPGWDNGGSNMVGQNGSDNAANYVSAASSNGAITYVETAYAKEHNEPVASVVNASGNAVQPTSVNDATALEGAILHADLTQDLSGVYTNPLANAYPISAYSYFVTPCSPSLAAGQHTACAANNNGTSSFPADKGQALGQFVSFIACAGQEKMALLGYSPLPPNLVQDDFDAVGRLNGGQEPPPPTPANCRNPYVDGETPLPGEPAVVGQAGGGLNPAAAAAALAASAHGSGGGAGGGGAAGGVAGGGAGGGGAGAGGAGGAGGDGFGVQGGPNSYERAAALGATVDRFLSHLSWVGSAFVWILVLLGIFVGVPLYLHRRRTAVATADGAPMVDPSPPDTTPGQRTTGWDPLS